MKKLLHFYLNIPLYLFQRYFCLTNYECLAQPCTVQRSQKVNMQKSTPISANFRQPYKTFLTISNAHSLFALCKAILYFILAFCTHTTFLAGKVGNIKSQQTYKRKTLFVSIVVCMYLFNFTWYQNFRVFCCKIILRRRKRSPIEKPIYNFKIRFQNKLQLI